MLRVVISSVGRRNYLVHWFKEALQAEELEGEVITTDADRDSPGATAGDKYIAAPAYHDSAYVPFMRSLFSTAAPDLVISANDYEISLISRLIHRGKLAAPRLNFFPGLDAQTTIEDKYKLYKLLSNKGIATPPTILGTDLTAMPVQLAASPEYIVKHRFGSASSGIQLATARTLDHAVAVAAINAPDAHGTIHRDGNERTRVVIQPRLAGDEYGVDGVFSALAGGQLEGTLARRKLRMRSGETDRAITVAPNDFIKPVAAIGSLFRFKGIIDMDFIVDHRGTPNVIDINPRFGGGYPFVHVAGADVPRHYVRVATGAPLDRSLLSYTHDVVGAKYAMVRRTR